MNDVGLLNNLHSWNLAYDYIADEFNLLERLSHACFVLFLWSVQQIFGLVKHIICIL